LRIEGRFCRRDEGCGQVGFWEGGEIGREFRVFSFKFQAAAWGHAAYRGEFPEASCQIPEETVWGLATGDWEL
jgi:hypothetical protein